MFLKIALLTLLLTGLVLSDDRADYDLLKLKVSEQRRVLGQHHQNRQYTEAVRAQEKIAKLSREALKIALSSPDIPNSDAWRYHANVMRDSGYTEDALEAVSQFLKTPLLRRSGFREGWMKRADIYQKQLDYPMAQDSLAKALDYADTPPEQFQILKTQARLYLKAADTERALSRALSAEKLLADIEQEHRLNAQRDLQSPLIKVYRELGESEKAREAKLKELELRRELLNKEIEKFNSEYPVE